MRDRLKKLITIQSVKLVRVSSLIIIECNICGVFMNDQEKHIRAIQITESTISIDTRKYVIHHAIYSECQNYSPTLLCIVLSRRRNEGKLKGKNVCI
jgi:hypothetical protein